jgi:gamma-glutamylcyclotransferase (GGCT)/AIG2-like uncharacterized protein YtfP
VSDYLFIYGTLLRDAAPPSVAGLLRRLRRIGAATVPGTLYDFERYPGIVLSGDGVVRGEIVAVPCAATWMRLDAYEGFDNARPQRSLFRRELCMATGESGQLLPCWTYVYNRDVRDAARIDGGCWRTHRCDGDYVVVPC